MAAAAEPKCWSTTANSETASDPRRSNHLQSRCVLIQTVIPSVARGLHSPFPLLRTICVICGFPFFFPPPTPQLSLKPTPPLPGISLIGAPEPQQAPAPLPGVPDPRV